MTQAQKQPTTEDFQQHIARAELATTAINGELEVQLQAMSRRCQALAADVAALKAALAQRNELLETIKNSYVQTNEALKAAQARLAEIDKNAPRVGSDLEAL